MTSPAPPAPPASSASTRSRTTKRIALGTVGGAALVVVLLAAFFLAVPVDSGQQVMREGNEEDLRALVSVVLGSYGDLTALVTSAFGAVAFLVAFQHKDGQRLSDRAWGMLSAGIVCLTGALVLTLLGRELMLLMIARNAVELTLPALLVGRWATYICLIAAAVLVGFFAVEVAVTPAAEHPAPPPSTAPPTEAPVETTKA